MPRTNAVLKVKKAPTNGRKTRWHKVPIVSAENMKAGKLRGRPPLKKSVENIEQLMGKVDLRMEELDTRVARLENAWKEFFEWFITRIGSPDIERRVAQLERAAARGDRDNG